MYSLTVFSMVLIFILSLWIVILLTLFENIPDIAIYIIAKQNDKIDIYVRNILVCWLIIHSVVINYIVTLIIWLHLPNLCNRHIIGHNSNNNHIAQRQMTEITWWCHIMFSTMPRIIKTIIICNIQIIKCILKW